MKNWNEIGQVQVNFNPLGLYKKFIICASYVINQVLHVWVSWGHMIPKSNFLYDWITSWKRNGIYCASYVKKSTFSYLTYICEIRVASVACFPFQYFANAKLFQFWDSEKICLLVHHHSNRSADRCETHEKKTSQFCSRKSLIKVIKYTKIWEKNFVISSDFGFVPNI